MKIVSILEFHELQNKSKIVVLMSELGEVVKRQKNLEHAGKTALHFKTHFYIISSYISSASLILLAIYPWFHPSSNCSPFLIFLYFRVLQ